MASTEIFSKVSRRMWGDQKFLTLSAPQPNARDLWLYLLTGPHNGAIPGLFELGELALAEKLEWEPEPTRSCLQEILAKNMARFDRKRRLFWLPNAIDHNMPRSPKQVLGWAKAWSLLPECSLLSEAAADIRSHLAAKGAKFVEAFDRVVSGVADVTDSSDEEEETPTTSPSAGLARPPAALPDRDSGFYPIEPAVHMPFQEKEKEKEKEIAVAAAARGGSAERPVDSLGPASRLPQEAAGIRSDDPNPVPEPQSPALPPFRPGNGRTCSLASIGDTAHATGPDYLTMAYEMAESGNVFARKMVDQAANGSSLTLPQRDKIREIYTKFQSGLSDGARVAGMRAGATTGGLSDIERQALENWQHRWSREHRGETYPTTDRDAMAIRKLAERAASRARALGGNVSPDDVLNHYFARYLGLDDRRLVAERYPLCFLESRLPAIGEYEPPKARPATAPPPPAQAARERAPLKVPDGIIEEISAPRASGDALRARRL